MHVVNGRGFIPAQVLVMGKHRYRYRYRYRFSYL
jgi:hypothetical protein